MGLDGRDSELKLTVEVWWMYGYFSLSLFFFSKVCSRQIRKSKLVSVFWFRMVCRFPSNIVFLWYWFGILTPPTPPTNILIGINSNNHLLRRHFVFVTILFWYVFYLLQYLFTLFTLNFESSSKLYITNPLESLLSWFIDSILIIVVCLFFYPPYQEVQVRELLS